MSDGFGADAIGALARRLWLGERSDYGNRPVTWCPGFLEVDHFRARAKWEAGTQLLREQAAKQVAPQPEPETSEP